MKKIGIFTYVIISSLISLLCISCTNRHSSKTIVETDPVDNTESLLKTREDSLIYATAVLSDEVKKNDEYKDNYVIMGLNGILEPYNIHEKVRKITTEVTTSYKYGQPLLMSEEEAKKYLSVVREFREISIKVDGIEETRDFFSDPNLLKFLDHEEYFLLSTVDSLNNLSLSNASIANFDEDIVKDMLNKKINYSTDNGYNATKNWHFFNGGEDFLVLENYFTTNSNNSFQILLYEDHIEIHPLFRYKKRMHDSLTKDEPASKIILKIGNVEEPEEDYSLESYSFSKDKMNYIATVFEKGNFEMCFYDENTEEKEIIKIKDETKGALKALELVKKSSKTN